MWPLLLNRFFDGTRQAGSIIAGGEDAVEALFPS